MLLVNTELKKEDKNKATCLIFWFIMDKLKKLIKEYIPYIVILVVILLIKNYVVSPIIVNGDSMDSTLKNGDVMILNKMYTTEDIKRFDIVVIKYEGRYIIKRIIGMPGDEVKIEDNTLYINGKIYVQDFLDKDTETENFIMKEVPKDHYFVLGDNREVSLDSRSFGPVSAEDIKGKAIYTIFPFNRWGTKE